MQVAALLVHLGVAEASSRPARPLSNGFANESQPAPMDADETVAAPPSDPTTKRELFELIDYVAGGVLGPHLGRLLGADPPPVQGGRAAVLLLAVHWSTVVAQLEQPAAATWGAASSAVWGAASSRWAMVDSPGKTASRIAQCRSRVFALCESLEPSQDVRPWTRLRFEALIESLRDTVDVLCADDTAVAHVDSLRQHLDYVFDV